MALTLFSFPERQERQSDWSNAELAELYRVQHSLAQAGIPHEVGRGVSDEGDPWYTFGSLDGEVFVHITRFDGLYRLFSSVLGEPLTGATFSLLTKAFANRIPVNVRQERGSSVVIHPSSFLSLIIASIFFASEFLVSGAANVKGSDESSQSGGESSGQVDDAVINFFAELTNPSVHEAKLSLESEEALRESQLNQWIFVQTAIMGAAIQFEMSTAVASPPGMIEMAYTSVADASGRDVPREFGLIASKLESGPAGHSVEGFYSLELSPSNSPPLISIAGFELSDAVRAEERSLFGGESEVGAVPEGQKAPDRPIEIGFSVTAQGGFGSADQPVAVVRVAGGLEVAVNRAGDNGVVISATGDGALTLTDISGTNTPRLFFTGAAVVVSLEYARNGIGVSVNQYLTLNGKTDVTIEQIEIAGAKEANQKIEEFDLHVVSDGVGANALRINETTSPARSLNIYISGKDDISISEKAALFENTKVNAAEFSGYLNFAIDLGGDGTSQTMLAIGASNYAVKTNNSLALMNLPREVAVGIATSLHDLVLNFEQTVPSILAKAMLELKASVDSSEVVSISSISTRNVPLLNIVSSGDPGGRANRIDSINDPDLSVLTISGDTDLVIDKLAGLHLYQGDGIAVDARAFAGDLTLDLSSMTGMEGTSLQIVMQAGTGDIAIRNVTVGSKTIFVTGSGTTEIEIGRGDVNDTIIGLKAGDTVALAGGTAVSRVSSALDLSAAQQSSIDALNSLQAAAETASRMIDAPGSERAILFYHNKNAYIFLDQVGDGSFDAHSDAIINLVGMLKIDDFSNIFSV